MKTDAMEPTLAKAARDLQTSYDLAAHGQAGAAHAQALDPEFIDRFGIVGPLETVVRRFERLAQLGLDFCRVIPGSRDAAARRRLELDAATRSRGSTGGRVTRHHVGQ